MPTTVVGHLNTILQSILRGFDASSYHGDDPASREAESAREVSETYLHKTEALRRLLELTAIPEKRKNLLLQEFGKNVAFYFNDPNRLFEKLWLCGLSQGKAERIVRRFFAEIQPALVVQLRPLETARADRRIGVGRGRETSDPLSSNWQRNMRGLKLYEEIQGLRDSNRLKLDDHNRQKDFDKLRAEKWESDIVRNRTEIARAATAEREANRDPIEKALDKVTERGYDELFTSFFSTSAASQKSTNPSSSGPSFFKFYLTKDGKQLKEEDGSPVFLLLQAPSPSFQRMAQNLRILA